MISLLCLLTPSAAQTTGEFTYVQTIDNAPGMGDTTGFAFGVSKSYSHAFDTAGKTILSAKLEISAGDVDSSLGEIDIVYGDGVNLGNLQGWDLADSVTAFSIPPSLLADGDLNVFVDIDSTHDVRWFGLIIYWSRLTVTYQMGGIIITEVMVSPASAVVEAGQALQFSAAAKDDQGQTIPGVQFTWSVEPPEMGSVSASGLFSAGSQMGSTKVVAVVGTVRGEANVAIGQPDFVLITPGPGLIPKGGKTTFTALGFHYKSGGPGRPPQGDPDPLDPDIKSQLESDYIPLGPVPANWAAGFKQGTLSAQDVQILGNTQNVSSLAVQSTGNTGWAGPGILASYTRSDGKVLSDGSAINVFEASLVAIHHSRITPLPFPSLVLKDRQTELGILIQGPLAQELRIKAKYEVISSPNSDPSDYALALQGRNGVTSVDPIKDAKKVFKATALFTAKKLGKYTLEGKIDIGSSSIPLKGTLYGVNVNLAAIKFNFSNDANSGIPARSMNQGQLSTIETPEWNSTRSLPAVYGGGQKIQLQAEFTVEPKEAEGEMKILELFSKGAQSVTEYLAIPTSSNGLIQVGAGTTSTGFVTFTTNLEWQSRFTREDWTLAWNFYHPEPDPNPTLGGSLLISSLASNTHRIYTLLSPPGAPWKIRNKDELNNPIPPINFIRTDVLDYLLDTVFTKTAAGKTTPVIVSRAPVNRDEISTEQARNMVAEAILSSQKFKYDAKNGRGRFCSIDDSRTSGADDTKNSYANVFFDFTFDPMYQQFLSSSTVSVNCCDASSFMVCLANSYGDQMHALYWNWYASPSGPNANNEWFYLNVIDPIGLWGQHTNNVFYATDPSLDPNVRKDQIAYEDGNKDDHGRTTFGTHMTAAFQEGNSSVKIWEPLFVVDSDGNPDNTADWPPPSGNINPSRVTVDTFFQNNLHLNVTSGATGKDAWTKDKWKASSQKGYYYEVVIDLDSDPTTTYPNDPTRLRNNPYQYKYRIQTNIIDQNGFDVLVLQSVPSADFSYIRAGLKYAIFKKDATANKVIPSFAAKRLFNVTIQEYGQFFIDPTPLIRTGFTPTMGACGRVTLTLK